MHLSLMNLAYAFWKIFYASGLYAVTRSIYFSVVSCTEATEM